MNSKKTAKIAFIVSFLVQLFLFLVISPALSQDQTSPGDYLIGPQDELTLTLYAGGVEQQVMDLTVSAQGMINVPFIGPVKAGGLPIDKLEDRITKALAKDYFVNPQVNIHLKGYQSLQHQISVEGEIKKPGVYKYQRGMTALNACIMAGGFDKYAAPNRTIIIRKENGKQIVIKVKLDDVKEGKAPDMELRPGDRIHVPETWL
ncbi:MAG: polysaccharide biosynthesis/export family protein, partial [Deltaproteobacteria bacterium]|nr:polysaccharide biosynthesis/export family protein [Deltaproteobacteria bacterium]